MALAVIIHLVLYIANLVFILDKNILPYRIPKGKIVFTLLNLLSLACGIFLMQFAFAISHFDPVTGIDKAINMKTKFLLAIGVFILLYGTYSL
ncbi:hypothetical protein I6G82_10020 [Lysinibacillus macroides]|uniref:Uncharacterized protein n=1 Tax=Lysinibacillus macroides TaxID=33935 RepID=A0A0N0UW76_9BACI|nr:hypothetical protein [Lysinibacillus macroides]KOY80734.1 hypothetical protein ADM90_16250 [Lysinibacillus macroides]QPR69876.1 hypothetical protein I6G82_10020 [Lysinibacillus macroides]